MKQQKIPRVLLVAAMEEEIPAQVRHYDFERNVGLYVDFLITGEGKIKAAMNLTEKLLSNVYALVINVGTCAGVHGCSVMDILVACKVSSVDVDYVGGVFNFPDMYIHSKYLSLDICDGGYACMYSNDKFLTAEYYAQIKDKLIKYNAAATTYDMESFAYASVCNHFGVSFLEVRCVTDKPVRGYDDAGPYVSFKNNLPRACKRLGEYIIDFIKANALSWVEENNKKNKI